MMIPTHPAIGVGLISVLLAGCAASTTVEPSVTPNHVTLVPGGFTAGDGDVIARAQTLEIGDIEGPMRTVDLTPPAPAAIISDVLHDDAGVVTICWRDHAVETGVITAAWRWSSRERRDVDTLGIRPRTLNMNGGELWVTGEGGVVRWSTNERFLDGRTIKERLAFIGDQIIACEDRRAYDVRDGRYLGSASALVRWRDRLIFIRRGDDDTAFGVMHRQVREVDVDRLSDMIDGGVRAVHVFEDDIWLVQADRLIVVPIEARDDGLTLSTPTMLPYAGVRDVDRRHPNRLLLLGDLGARVIDTDQSLTTIAATSPAGGGVTSSAFDGQVLLIEGAWGRAAFGLDGDRLHPVPPMPMTAPVQSVSTTTLTAAWMDAGVRWSTPDGSAGIIDLPSTAGFRAMCSATGLIWVGHRDGLTLLGPRDDGSPTVRTFRGFPRIIGLHPLLDGTGVIAVSDIAGVRVYRP